MNAKRVHKICNLLPLFFARHAIKFCVTQLGNVLSIPHYDRACLPATIFLISEAKLIVTYIFWHNAVHFVHFLLLNLKWISNRTYPFFVPIPVTKQCLLTGLQLLRIPRNWFIACQSSVTRLYKRTILHRHVHFFPELTLNNDYLVWLKKCSFRKLPRFDVWKGWLRNAFIFSLAQSFRKLKTSITILMKNKVLKHFCFCLYINLFILFIFDVN